MRHDVTYQTARTDLLALEKKILLIRSRVGRSFAFATPADLDERLRP
jgi:hypothetical protein